MNRTAVSLLAEDFVAVKIALIAEAFSQIVADYRKSPTPYRRSLIKKAAHDPYLGFSLAECLAAVDLELAKSTDFTSLEKAPSVLSTYVRTAIWRIANIEESKHVFEMFKTRPKEALEHIKIQLSAFYRDIASYVLNAYGYDLTLAEFANVIWLHLSNNGTWRAFSTYRGEGSIYSWMRKVCRHCIIDYVEDCGYTLQFTKDEYDEAEDEVDDDLFEGELADVKTFRTKTKKYVLRYDVEEVGELSDSRPLFDTDFIDNAFLTDRINEMPWEEWLRRFMIDSIIEDFSATTLTEKYGAEVAYLHGKQTPYTRTWTDNINSRKKREFYAYVQRYINGCARFAA